MSVCSQSQCPPQPTIDLLSVYRFAFSRNFLWMNLYDTYLRCLVFFIIFLKFILSMFSIHVFLLLSNVPLHGCGYRHYIHRRPCRQVIWCHGDVSEASGSSEWIKRTRVYLGSLVWSLSPTGPANCVHKVVHTGGDCSEKDLSGDWGLPALMGVKVLARCLPRSTHTYEPAGTWGECCNSQQNWALRKGGQQPWPPRSGRGWVGKMLSSSPFPQS